VSLSTHEKMLTHLLVTGTQLPVATAGRDEHDLS